MFPDENGEPIDFSSFFEITNEAMLADLYLTCLSTNAVEQIPDTLKESFNKIVKQIEDYLEQYIEEEMECDEYEKELDYMRRHIS
jgi:predicted Zn-dependent protease with MMP-like domain